MSDLRSDQWYGGNDRDSYIHRAWMRRGLPAQRVHRAAADRDRQHRLRPDPVQQAPERGRRPASRPGIWEAGGIPLDMPVMSLGETLVRPTAMLWRNMAAMAAEEMIRANPIDGVVLLGGCDKTIPALLMAAASVDLPAVVVPGGPMLTGTSAACRSAAARTCGGCREEVRAGNLSEQDFLASESAMIRSRGHCNTMGTASTMACMAEALGMTLPGVAGTAGPGQPAARAAHASGRLAVELVSAGRTPEPGPERRLVPQRHRGAGRDRRLDQRRGAPAGHRRAGSGCRYPG